MEAAGYTKIKQRWGRIRKEELGMAYQNSTLYPARLKTLPISNTTKIGGL